MVVRPGMGGRGLEGDLGLADRAGARESPTDPRVFGGAAGKARGRVTSARAARLVSSGIRSNGGRADPIGRACRTIEIRAAEPQAGAGNSPSPGRGVAQGSGRWRGATSRDRGRTGRDR